MTPADARTAFDRAHGLYRRVRRLQRTQQATDEDLHRANRQYVAAYLAWCSALRPAPSPSLFDREYTDG